MAVKDFKSTSGEVVATQVDVNAYFESYMGGFSVPTEEWLPQIERYSAQGLVIDESLAQIGRSLSWFYEAKTRSTFYSFSKRVFDIFLATLAMPLVLPVLAVSAVAIKMNSKGPVFFCQLRLGKFGVPFYIFKFRTMNEQSPLMLSDLVSDSKGGFFKKNDDPRVHSVGKILRRWSIDELPQIFNILIGDMSFVGPRPLPVYDIACIPTEYLCRLAVPPGLTGLWQITARDSNDAKRNLAIDKEYVLNRSIKKDLWILYRTPYVVLKGTGAR